MLVLAATVNCIIILICYKSDVHILVCCKTVGSSYRLVSNETLRIAFNGKKGIRQVVASNEIRVDTGVAVHLYCVPIKVT